MVSKVAKLLNSIAPRLVKKGALLALCMLICMRGNAAEGETDRYRIVAYVAGRSAPAVMNLEKVTM